MLIMGERRRRAVKPIIRPAVLLSGRVSCPSVHVKVIGTGRSETLPSGPTTRAAPKPPSFSQHLSARPPVVSSAGAAVCVAAQLAVAYAFLFPLRRMSISFAICLSLPWLLLSKGRVGGAFCTLNKCCLNQWVCSYGSLWE